MEGNKVIYPELSYKIVGSLFQVYNELGPGYQEKYYEKAVIKELIKNNIKFKSQVPVTVVYKGEKIGRYYLDLLIEDKIVVELKRGNYFNPKNIKQVIGYLKATSLKLGIIAVFTSEGVKYKRILNIK